MKNAIVKAAPTAQRRFVPRSSSSLSRSSITEAFYTDTWSLDRAGAVSYRTGPAPDPLARKVAALRARSSAG